MKQNALIAGPHEAAHLDRLKRALELTGFSAARVTRARDALYRLDNEIFSVLICQEAADGVLQRELAAGLPASPFGATTPILLLGAGPQPQERALLTSLLDQYFPHDTDASVIADFVGETHALRGEKAKRGRLGPVALPRILAQTSRVRFDGAVVVEREEEKAIVYMEAGCVVFASSSRDENRFGEFLAARRIISHEEFLHAVRIMQSGVKKRLGRILVEEGFLKPQVLATLVQSQVKQIVFSVFDWGSGDFFLLPEEASRQEEAVARFEVPPLILEGVRLKFTEGALSREFEPFDSRVSLALPLAECRRRLHLGRHETDFLRLVGQGRPIADFLSMNSYSRAESLKLLYSFKVLGFLAFEPGAAPPEAGKPRAFDGPDALREPSVPGKPPPPAGRRRWAGPAVAAAAGVLAAGFWAFARFRPGGGAGSGKESVRAAAEAPPAPKNSASPAFAGKADIERWLAAAGERRRAGRPAEALAVLEEGRAAGARDVSIELWRGELLAELGRSAEAEEAYEAALEEEPGNWRAHLALGTIFLSQEREIEAAAHFRRYLAAVPRSAGNEARTREVENILKAVKSR